MRILTPFQALGAAAVAAMLVACSGGPAIAPTPTTPQAIGRGIVDPLSANFNARLHHLASFNSCPRNGTTEYVSDYNYDVVYIFRGKFAGQYPCGQITSGIFRPTGLYVDPSTHDLYVANYVAGNVLVFHKGQTVPYNTYTDPTGQAVLDVRVGKDGTIFATNTEQNPNAIEKGSISTWQPGPNGGTFVGNFPMTSDQLGGHLTVQRNGVIYYWQINDNQNGNLLTLWHVSCPAGHCGPETQVPHIYFGSPGDMLFYGGDMLVADAGQLDTFELPNPTPSMVSAPGIFGMTIDAAHNHLFDTNGSQTASEYSYPSMTLIGTVPGTPNGEMFGMAVDPY